MKGFYSIWTKPFFDSSSKKEYYMRDFELLTLMVSSLEWRKHNGPVKMFADDTALQYLKKMGLQELFDNGMESFTVDEDINPRVFWAAGKLYALRQLHEPMAMIDLDLIVWKNVDDFLATGDIMVIHREELRPHIYPDFSFFHMNSGYQFSRSLDAEALPCNTAFLFLKSMEFKNAYVDSALQFMKNCAETQENLCHMVFAEQRLIAALATSYGQKISAAFPLAADIGNQDMFTHVWGHKNILKYNYRERMSYCVRCLHRIREEFPDWYEKIKSTKALQTEFEEYIRILESA